MSDSDSVFGRMKSLVTGGAARAKYQLTGLNLPWLLARCDSAYQEVTVLFKGGVYIRDCREKKEYYNMLVGMVTDIIDSLQQIHTDAVRNSKGRPVDPDESLPVLEVIRQSSMLLREGAGLSLTLSTEGTAAENFGGAELLSRFHMIEDASADMEVEMLHSITELFNQIAPVMQKTCELRKRALSQSGLESYHRAFAELISCYEKQKTR